MSQDERRKKEERVRTKRRKETKTINLKDINKLPNKQKNKVNRDLKNIKKKRTFKKLNLSNIPILMGIINLTPDSFSDGGKYNKKNLAKKRVYNLLSSGAKIIDVETIPTEISLQFIKAEDIRKQQETISLELLTILDSHLW